MLNIKNHQTEHAVRQLAAQLDIGLTEAVHLAVRNELQRLANERATYLRQISQAARAVQSASRPDEWLDAEQLYGEDGLPK